MLEVIHRLRMEFLERTMANPPSVDEEDDELVLSPTDLPGYPRVETSDLGADSVKARDELLLQYFCGWAALNAAKYRRFVILDGEHTNNTVNHSWHVLFREPAKFNEEHRAP